MQESRTRRWTLPRISREDGRRRRAVSLLSVIPKSNWYSIVSVSALPIVSAPPQTSARSWLTYRSVVIRLPHPLGAPGCAHRAGV